MVKIEKKNEVKVGENLKQEGSFSDIVDEAQYYSVCYIIPFIM